MNKTERERTEQEKILHTLRKSIDGMINMVGELKTVDEFKPAGREISLSFTKLEEAKMWLGKALGALGSYLPPEYRDEATMGGE